MRRLKIVLTSAALALAAFFAPSPAFADDFTFTVPVRIENMPGLATATVFCGLAGVDATTGFPRAIGVGGRTDVPLSGGAYRGNVTVVANVPAGDRRDAVTRWSCHMNFFARTADGRTTAAVGNTDAEVTGTYSRVTGQEIVSSHLFVNGTR